MTTNQKIERSREIRLWITQVIAPIAILLSFPDARLALVRAYNNVRFKVNNLITKIKSKFKKG